MPLAPTMPDPVSFPAIDVVNNIRQAYIDLEASVIRAVHTQVRDRLRLDEQRTRVLGVLNAAEPVSNYRRSERPGVLTMSPASRKVPYRGMGEPPV